MNDCSLQYIRTLVETHHGNSWQDYNVNAANTQTNSMALVRERTVPTERQAFAGEAKETFKCTCHTLGEGFYIRVVGQYRSITWSMYLN
jgi:hypothetical protein